MQKPESTPDSRFARRRVLVIGVGGLGAAATVALAAAGVGGLGLMDPDPVELSNLHRQLLYANDDLGQLKVDVARRWLARRYPKLTVTTWALRFDAAHARVVRDFDVVIDGTDSMAAKFLISDVAVLQRVPLVHAGVLGLRAQLTTIIPGVSACLRCIFEEEPPADEVPTCQAAGVLGPIVNLAGTLQAAEAVAVLRSGRGTHTGQLLTIDARQAGWRSVPLYTNPHCPMCTAHQDPEIGRRSEA